MSDKSLSDILLASRQLSNYETSGFVDDTQELPARVNEAVLAYYDLVLEARETYFQKTFPFTLAGGYSGNTVPIPSDLYKVQYLDRNPGTSSVERVPTLPSEAERHCAPHRCYDWNPNGLTVLPPETSAGNYLLTYTPRPPVLAAPVVINATGPVPGTGVWPSTYKTWLIDPNIQNSLGGSLTPNQKDLILRWKNSYVASGQWTVVQSSTPTVMANSDLWLTTANIARPGTSGGPYSWIVLQRRDGVQLVMIISLDASWLEPLIYISPSGAFAGGVAGARPTATDEILVQDTTYGGGTNWLGREGNPSNNQLYTMHNWQSTDGTCSYTVIQGTNHTQTVIAIFRAQNPSPGWTPPVAAWLIFGGPSQNTGAVVPNIDAAMGNQMVEAISPARAPFSMDIALSGLNAGSFSRALSQWPHADVLSGKWALWKSSLFSFTAAGASAGHGVVPDMWWTYDASFSQGGTYNDGNGNAVIYFNTMVLPWKPGVVPLGFTPSTVGPFYATGV